jgi:type II secretory pathway pseudopilin PulG
MRSRRGISLFEAVFALAILGVTAIGALAAVGAEMRTAQRARRVIEVEALSNERLVFLYLLTDRDLLNLPDSVAAGQFEPPFDHYKWTTTSTPNDTYPGLYDVKVTIAWSDGPQPASFTASAAQYRRPVVARRSR